jgi:hypothetical protein
MRNAEGLLKSRADPKIGYESTREGDRCEARARLHSGESEKAIAMESGQAREVIRPDWSPEANEHDR